MLRRLIKASLHADIKKCEFFTTKTKYLGIIITLGGMEIDPKKVCVIIDWEPLVIKRQL